MIILYYFLLFLLLLTGLAITLMTLPGLWLMLASAAVYGWVTKWNYVGWRTLLTLLVLAGLGEVVELVFSAKGARQSGAGRRGMWGALIGGAVGGIFLSFIPIPILSTLLGVCLGTFLGAMIGELSGGREVGHSAIVGVGAAKGRLMGTLAKVAIGGVMFVMTLWVALPWPSRSHKVVATQPVSTMPSARP